MTDQLSGGVVQPTDAQINGEAPNARNLLAALIDIYDDTQDCPPEHRCYVPEAWGDTLRMARQFLALPHAPLQAEPVPVVASEPDYDAKQQKTLRAIRSFLSSEYSKDATTPAKIARQRQIGALLDSMDRMQK